jgi:hypothetical protein
MRWREEVAKASGLPPLRLMQGFYEPDSRSNIFRTCWEFGEVGEKHFAVKLLDESLPIKWDCLKPSALHELLYHSDCGGEIEWDRCEPIADELEKLLPKLEGDFGGHIGDIKAKTETFINGLRSAHNNKENVEFY